MTPLRKPDWPSGADRRNGTECRKDTMIKLTSESDRVLAAKLQEVDQDHVFDFWDDLTPQAQKELLAELRGLDLARLKTLIEDYRKAGAAETTQDRVFEPGSFARLPSSEEEARQWRKAREIGETVLREGKVAVLLSAGQVDCASDPSLPAGVRSVGPVSGKSLFCLQAEKVRALGRRYRASIPLFVVTSAATHESTVQFFQENDHFGLGRQDVKFLRQQNLPIINKRGRLLMQSSSSLATAPNGDGACLMEMLGDDNYRQLELRDIQHVFFARVQNPLVQLADPTFLGQHIVGDYEISSKVVIKTDGNEPLAVFCRCNGADTVVPHDELPDADQQRRLPNGGLAFCAANTGIHFFSMEFLKTLREEKVALPYHFVPRCAPYVDRRGRLMNPKKANGIVFEQFVCDALQWATRTLVIETDRLTEFPPEHNGDGSDPVTAATKALNRMYLRWLGHAGAQLPGGRSLGFNGDSPDFSVEISPLFALSADELKEKVTLPLEVTAGLYLE